MVLWSSIDDVNRPINVWWDLAQYSEQWKTMYVHISVSLTAWQRLKYGNCGVLVSGCFLKHGLGPLHAVDRNVNSESYKEILDNWILPTIMQFLEMRIVIIFNTIMLHAMFQFLSRSGTHWYGCKLSSMACSEYQLKSHWTFMGWVKPSIEDQRTTSKIYWPRSWIGMDKNYHNSAVVPEAVWQGWYLPYQFRNRYGSYRICHTSLFSLR